MLFARTSTKKNGRWLRNKRLPGEKKGVPENPPPVVGWCGLSPLCRRLRQSGINKIDTFEPINGERLLSCKLRGREEAKAEIADPWEIVKRTLATCPAHNRAALQEIQIMPIFMPPAASPFTFGLIEMNQHKYNYSSLHIALEQLEKDLSTLHDLTMVTIRGLTITQAIPNVVTALAKYKENEESDDHKLILENAERIARIAKREIDEDFPFLYAHSVIMLYSYLEGAVKRIIIDFFKANNITKIKEVATIKIQYGEFVHLDEDDQLDYLFSQYEKGLTAGIQYGITRFETLLTPIGLSGKVGDMTSKAIYELSQIRNNILHRGGKADNHFLRSCPWVEVSYGERVKISKEKYTYYYNAIGRYLIILLVRLADKTGNKKMEDYRNIE